MTYLAFDAREVTTKVITLPDLAEQWKHAAQHNLIKPAGLGRYSVVLDDTLAKALTNAFPDLATYSYNDGDDSIQISA